MLCNISIVPIFREWIQNNSKNCNQCLYDTSKISQQSIQIIKLTNVTFLQISKLHIALKDGIWIIASLQRIYGYILNWEKLSRKWLFKHHVKEFLLLFVFNFCQFDVYLLDRCCKLRQLKKMRVLEPIERKLRMPANLSQSINLSFDGPAFNNSFTDKLVYTLLVITLRINIIIYTLIHVKLYAYYFFLFNFCWMITLQN